MLTNKARQITLLLASTHRFQSREDPTFRSYTNHIMPSTTTPQTTWHHQCSHHIAPTSMDTHMKCIPVKIHIIHFFSRRKTNLVVDPCFILSLPPPNPLPKCLHIPTATLVPPSTSTRTSPHTILQPITDTPHHDDHTHTSPLKPQHTSRPS